jgi:hypothetical protein
MGTRRFLPILALLLFAATAAAESGAAPDHTHALCWRGKPLPECRSFLITELGVLYRLDSDPISPGVSRLHFSFDLGWMKNVSDHAAVGATAYGLAGTEHARTGIRGRYRHWLSRESSLDFAPGVLLGGGEDSGLKFQSPGFVGAIILNQGDWVAVTVEGEYSRFRSYGYVGSGIASQKSSDMTWRAGAKLGSAPGTIGAILLVGAAIVIVATFEGSFD